MGYEVISLPAFSYLDKRVAHHPDMLLFVFHDRILLHEAYFEENRSFFDALPFSFVTTNETITDTYPHDVLFNALPIGKTLYGGKTVSQAIESEFSHKVTVKQGYTRCSSSLVGNGVITQDVGIYQALTKNGVKALLISQGGIVLDGYDTGFIGGASITLSKRLTAFFGKLEDHPDYTRMKAFADEMGVTLISLSNEPLTDCGGGFCLSEQHIKNTETISKGSVQPYEMDLC